uniref:Uncharacterized protein n=1 Tax=Panagrolaimus sp. JU765 TaxID=591449 RepID=A0AC34QJ26_9BILA
MMTRNGTNSVIRHAANDRNHKARFLCCFASSWLVSVVLIESLIMVGWVVREYHVFDYTCIIARPNKSFGEMSGPRIIYAATDKQVRKRNLRVIEPEAPPNKFETSLAEFSTLALCAGRVALDIWCVAQLLAAVPFLIGICLRSQCLLFVRLMLDALFLVILFVYAITVIAFSVILYVLVDEMTTEVVCEWLVFGLLLTAVLLVAIAVFGVVLRCCELIVNERPKTKNKRSKSLLYTEIGSEQLLEAADEI